MAKNTENTFAKIGETFAELSSLFNQLGEAGVVTANTPVKEEKATKSSKKSKAPVEEVEEVEAGEYDYDTLNGMQIGELKELADEEEVEYTKSIKKQPLIKLLLEHFSSEEEDGEEEEEEEEVEVDEDEEELDTVVETEDGDVDLAELNVKELKKFAKEYEIELTAKSKDDIILEILEGLEDEEEDGEDEDEDEDGDGFDVDSASLEELKEFAEENGITLPSKKKVQKAPAYLQIVKDTINEALESEDEDEEGEVDIAEEYGLNDMDAEELAELLESYELSTKGKKQALIDRIVKAVEDGTIDLDDEEEGE